MTCPNGEMSNESGCSGVDNITGVDNNTRLDVRVEFRGNGLCDNQTIRWLNVHQNGMLVYKCSNLISFTSVPCESNDRFQVIVDPECPPCVSSDLQCCKYSIYLYFIPFNASIFGEYVATVELSEDGNRRLQMTKTFYGTTIFL